MSYQVGDTVYIDEALRVGVGCSAGTVASITASGRVVVHVPAGPDAVNRRSFTATGREVGKSNGFGSGPHFVSEENYDRLAEKARAYQASRRVHAAVAAFGHMQLIASKKAELQALVAKLAEAVDAL